MKLLEYLKSLGGADARASFAARCKTSPGHLNNIAYGYKPCSETLAIDIERESDGAVTVEETCPKADWAVIRGKPAPSEAAA